MKEKDLDLFHFILKYLYDNNSLDKGYLRLNEVIKKRLETFIELKYVLITQKSLSALQESGLIIYLFINNDLEKVNQDDVLGKIVNGKMQTLDSHELLACITVNGYKYIYQLLLTSSQANSVISTNKVQKFSLIITGAAIVVSCAFQVRSWYVSNEQLQTSKSQYILDSQRGKAESLTIDGLMQKTNSIQKRLDEMQKQKTSK